LAPVFDSSLTPPLGGGGGITDELPLFGGLFDVAADAVLLREDDDLLAAAPEMLDSFSLNLRKCSRVGGGSLKSSSMAYWERGSSVDG